MMARPASGMWSKPSTANASIRVLLPEPGPPVMTWKSGRSAIARTFRFRVDRALAPPLPERQHIASVVALHARCTIETRAVKGGTLKAVEQTREHPPTTLIPYAVFSYTQK